MRRILSLFTLISLIYTMPAQTRTFTLSLYYEINQVSSQRNFERLDSLCKILEDTPVNISIYGYADYLNTTVYNKVLSEKRAGAVKNHLLKKELVNLTILQSQGLGEKNSKDNQSAEGEASERRVDVVLTQEIPRKKIGTRENIVHEQEKISEEKKEPEKEKKGIEDLDKGESLALEGLNFIAGRHMLVKSAVPVLEDLLTTLKEHPTLKIEIQGHICCLDPDYEDGLDYDTNEKKLSENRAKSVYNYLVRNGIDKERLTYKGYGHSNPKIKNEMSSEDEQINRRVEIKILEN